MKIRRISAYRVELPLHEGSYKWSGGNSVAVFDSTLVRVETDGGLVGHGEVCPLGPAYLPAYAEGVRAGLAVLGPSLIGEDPRELEKLNRRMDASLKGHPYVKSGIDIACWDILGQAAGVPVATLLGGRYGEDFVLYRAISQEAPEEMARRVAGYRDEGYRRFQLKVGGDPDVDVERIRAVRGVLAPGEVLIADANTGWLPHQAARVVRARPRRGRLRGAALRDLRGMPLDPPAHGPPVRARRDDRRPRRPPARGGGPRDGRREPQDLEARRAHPHAPGPRSLRLARDRHDDRGLLGRRRDDGGDRAPRAFHADELLFTSTDFNSYVTVSTATGAPQRKNGRMAASTAPGLGVTPRPEFLRKPAVDVS